MTLYPSQSWAWAAIRHCAPRRHPCLRSSGRRHRIDPRIERHVARRAVVQVHGCRDGVHPVAQGGCRDRDHDLRRGGGVGAAVAYEPEPMTPAGRLERATSTPLTKTTTPSSARVVSVTPLSTSASATVNGRRNCALISSTAYRSTASDDSEISSVAHVHGEGEKALPLRSRHPITAHVIASLPALSRSVQSFAKDNTDGDDIVTGLQSGLETARVLTGATARADIERFRSDRITYSNALPI